MTCLSSTPPLPQRIGIALLRAWPALLQHHVSAIRNRHDPAMLDDRARRDLGLSREVVAFPKDSAELWLNRVPG